MNQLNIANYIEQSAKLAAIGYKLRTKYAGDDFKWTAEEEKEWDDQCLVADKMWNKLTWQQRDLIESLELILAKICRGENP